MRCQTFAVLLLVCCAAALSAQAKQVPRMSDGHPDFNGYWKGMRNTVPVGNIAKDLPGLKLPLTPAGGAGGEHNTTGTVAPQSPFLSRGSPRQHASRLPF